MTRHVLIAEREANMQACLRFLMEREGYVTRVVKDGAEVLAAIDDAVPDLVLLSVELDRYDGFELCRLLRIDGRCAQLMILVVTAKARDIEREKAMALGADDYMTKPFANDDLMTRVRNLLAQSQTRVGG
jgi:DNA-binding response OmpR family regulator